jgi:hydrogenase/urease accessory protein HupE
VTGQLKLPRPLLGFADDNGDGFLVDSEMEAHRSDVEKVVQSGLQLYDTTVELPYTLHPTKLPGAPQLGHVSLELRTAEKMRTETLGVSFSLFDSKTTRAILRLDTGSQVLTGILTKEQPRLDLSTITTTEKLLGFFKLGVEHLLTGYDHILFLSALILGGGSLRALIAVVTSFTIAHSLTLALSVFELISLPAKPVEVGIAASIVIAAALNLSPSQKRSTAGRAGLAGGLGLLHGLGFAGVLREMDVSGQNATIPLLGFNLGVEAGQLLIVLLAYPALRAAQSRSNFSQIQRGLSWLLIGGGCWFLAAQF